MFELLSILLEGSKKLLNWHSNKLVNDLHPFFDSATIERSTKYYISTKCQDRPPHEHNEPSEAVGAAVQEDLIKYIDRSFRVDQHNYYLILAGAGMGKSTFMINLYKYLHGKFNYRYKIKLIPLGDPMANEEILNLSKETEKARKSVLLLDAFDEDPLGQDDYARRLDELLTMTRSFQKVVLTCRTQFFSSEEEEDFEIKIERQGEGGYNRFLKKYISPFSDDDISRYVKKRFGYGQTSSQAKNIVNTTGTLMARPLLLSWVDDIIKTDYYIYSSIDVYKYLIKAWIERESQKQLNKMVRDEISPSHFKVQMNEFVERVARHIALTSKKTGNFISQTHIQQIARNLNIDIAKIDVKSRSLLNRDPGGKYKFSHRSILEYLTAKIEFQLTLDQVGLSHSLKSELTYSFYSQFATRKTNRFDAATDTIVQEGYEFHSERNIRYVLIQKQEEFSYLELEELFRYRHAKKWEIDQVLDGNSLAGFLNHDEKVFKDYSLQELVTFRIRTYPSSTFVRQSGTLEYSSITDIMTKQTA